MGQSRIELQQLLEMTVSSDNVYFQPPPSLKMKYPCVVYKRDFNLTQFADGIPYKKARRYMVTVIDRNPDSELPSKIEDLPMCVFVRHFQADNLNHDVYNLYF